jgi:hypothetical protein
MAQPQRAVKVALWRSAIPHAQHSQTPPVRALHPIHLNPDNFAAPTVLETVPLRFNLRPAFDPDQATR